MFANSLAIIASIAAILGLYQFVLYLRKCYYRPIISIGILPVEEIKSKILTIRDIGERTGPNEINFFENMFAPLIDNHQIDQVMKSSPYVIRKIVRNKNNEYGLPIIIYNQGRSTLKDYKLNISFSEFLPGSIKTDTCLQLLDVDTETASVDGLYVNVDTYQGEKNKEKIPSSKIYNAYKAIDLSAHFVTFRGELGNGMYEMIYIKILIPKSVTQVAIYYEIDSRGEVPRAKRYGQYIEIIEMDGQQLHSL